MLRVSPVFTGFGAELRQQGIKRLWNGGLAEDACVRTSVLDASGEGFEVVLITALERDKT